MILNTFFNLDNVVFDNGELSEDSAFINSIINGGRLVTHPLRRLH